MATTRVKGLAISKAELDNIRALTEGADTVELKLTVPSPSSARRWPPRRRSDPAEIRQVYFFDTPDLALDQRGRRSACAAVQRDGRRLGREAAPGRARNIVAELRRSPNFGVEVDAMPAATSAPAR